MDSTGRPQPHARPRTLRTRHRDPGQRRYSSSDNEEERPGCDERRALNGGGLMHDSLHANTHLGMTPPPPPKHPKHPQIMCGL